MNELSECEEKEKVAYGDGYMAGVAEILRKIQDAIDNAERGYRLPAVEQILQDYGIREMSDKDNAHE